MSSDSLPAPPIAEGGACKVVLEVVEGLNCGARYEFDHHTTFFIGRAKKLPLRVLDDPQFSWHHCLLEVQPPRCYLRDLGSRNGTTVNGVRVEEAFLKDGDLIGAGKTHMRLNILNGELSPPLTDLVCQICAIRPSPATIPLASLSATSYLCPACREHYQLDPPPVPGYELDRRLGRGSLGSVWLAKHEATEELVAVKLIAPRSAVSERVNQHFLADVHRLAELKHPRLVGFREAGRSEGHFYIVTDYVDTVNVREVLGRVAPRKAAKAAVGIACQALEFLHQAHDRSLVHLDIKPTNFLVSKAGDRKLRTVLSDFGLARAFENLGLSGLTRSSDVQASLPFMAPELITDCHHDRPTADLYSVGASLYAFLSGTTPHVFAPNRDPYVTVLEYAAVPLRKRCPWLSPSLAELVHKAIQRKPRRRFRSAAEMFHALLPYAQGEVPV